MPIIQLLLGEHAVLTSAYDYLERVDAQLPLDQLFDLVRLVESLIAQHAILEDELLFDALPLQAAGIEDALRAMRREHQHIHESFSHVYDAPSLTEARIRLTSVFELLRDHFALEERVMFPLAGRTLGPRRCEELAATWSRRRHLASATL